MNFKSFVYIFKKKSLVMTILVKLFHVGFVLSQIGITPLAIFIIYCRAASFLPSRFSSNLLAIIF